MSSSKNSNNNNQWARGLFQTLMAPFSFFWNTTADENMTDKYNASLEDWIRANYGSLNLTDEEIEELINQYGDTADAKWWQIWSSGKDTSDTEALQETLDKLVAAHEELGEMPERYLSTEELADIRQQAEAEIDAENQRLLDLYEQTFQNSKNALQQGLQENAAMFGDYRNQLLTNEAMRQQALAGSTRFELERQQRNAITRGASAAQRLVANINAQLGLQAQSAQQSLDTSNALAQNLLAHRQAQQGIRNDYMTAQNQYNQNVASTIQGQSERKFNYGQSKIDSAESDRERAYQSWLDRRDDYFKGSPTASGIYGSGRNGL